MEKEGDYIIGSILGGRYLIEKEIGRGGVGVVYLARDKQLLSKPVVIKILLKGNNENSWFAKKFLQEIEALARIDHPGVIGVLDAGQMSDDKPYLVMQFVEGVNLRSIMKTGQMDFARVANIMRQIGQALSAAHDKGIYHRDLKPENIMVQSLMGGEEHVKLIDFGIATIKDSQVAPGEQTSTLAGTMAYLAPERLMGEVCAASDIYALGVIAYEMLTGEIPFDAKTVVGLYEMQRSGLKVKPKDLRPDIPGAAQGIILNALSFSPRHRHSNPREFGELLTRALSQVSEDQQSLQKTAAATGSRPKSDSPGKIATGPGEAATTALRTLQIVLLYKRNIEPDGYLLKLLESKFRAQGHSVFIDRHLSIGVEWAREIERQVRGADIVVPLLSALSVTSEMLAYEVQIASDAAQKGGKPRLLPVRINYEDPLPESMAALLNPIQYALWRGPEDDVRLVEEMFASLEPALPGLATKPRKLEAVGGAVPLDSEFYILRPTDEEFCSAIDRGDSIVLVKGARQMGKTSLLARGLQQAREAGSKIALTDFQTFNSIHLQSVDALFMMLAESLADQLDFDVLPSQIWNSERGASMNFNRYMRKAVLPGLESPLVWGMDEVDRLFACDFASEVFGLFRSWHNARSLDPTGPWQRLTLAIAYATEAHLFITDVNQSPFNVGTRLGLQDFTVEQVTELNHRYGSPLHGGSEISRFFRLVGGHPYLVRRSLQELATQKTDLDTFEATADRDEGPLGDHLRRMLILLAQDHSSYDVVRGVLRGEECPSMESFYRLRSAGVLSGDSSKAARPRCHLYETYLARHLV